MKSISRLLILGLAVVAVTGASLDRSGQQPSARLEALLLSAPPIQDILSAELLLKVHVVRDADLATPLDRREFLKRLVGRITRGSKTPQELVEKWTTWLQNHMVHSVKPPLDTEGQAVYDPIWLLKNRVAHCGQTNRILVDGLDAVGFKTRLVQFVAHVGAEVHYDGGWRYIDADIFDFGTLVRKSDGSLASGAEITAMPELIDTIQPFEEYSFYPKVRGEEQSLSVEGARAVIKEQFTKRVTHDGGFVTPYVWVKTASRKEEENKYFGWNYYHAEPGW